MINNRKIRIMHLITGLDIGGTEMFLSRLLPSLEEFDHTVVSLTDKNKIGAILKKNGITIYELKTGKLLSPSAIYCFYKIVKKERPDLLSTWLIHADIFGRIFGKLFGIKKVITNARLVLPFRKYWPYIIFTKLTKNIVDHWTANSKMVADFYIKNIGIADEKISVIYNGVDTQRFNISIDCEAKRRELSLSEDDFIIISVSRLSPQKGLERLIKAASLISAQHSSLSSAKKLIFLIAGAGTLEGKLRKMVVRLKLNNIRFLGNREDVPELLRISDLFVLPTLYEGMSNAIVEAMASGLPVITTDIPENRELIEDQKNGFLISLKDPHSLSNIIIDLYKDHRLRDRISQNAKQIILDIFDFQLTIRMFKNLYKIP